MDTPVMERPEPTRAARRARARGWSASCLVSLIVLVSPAVHAQQGDEEPASAGPALAPASKGDEEPAAVEEAAPEPAVEPPGAKEVAPAPPEPGTGINVVTSPHGSVKVGFVLQVGMDYVEAQPGTTTDDSFQIKPTRARLLLSGFVLKERINYLVQFDGFQGLQSILAGSEGQKRVYATAAEPAAPQVPFLLDVILMFDYIPKTTLKFGRYLSQFMYMMPRNTGDLYMIQYPLVLYKFGVWRQFSLESITTTKYLDVIVGVYNGPPNNWGDDNLYKDYNLKIRVKPAPWIHVGLFSWIGMPRSSVEGSTRPYALEATYGGELFVHPLDDRLKILFEGLARTHFDYAPGGYTAFTAFGFYAHASYQPVKQLEILGRFDYFDPSTEAGNDIGHWTTVGVNFFLDGINAKLSINYVYKVDETRSFRGWSELLTQASLHF
jgi:hypothetical protein